MSDELVVTLPSVYAPPFTAEEPRICACSLCRIMESGSRSVDMDVVFVHVSSLGGVTSSTNVFGGLP